MAVWAYLRTGFCLAAAALLLSGCGDTTRIPEAVSQTPVTASKIAVRQTGNAQVVIDQNSVSFRLDGSGALVVKASIRSTAAQSQTVIMRASVFDPAGSQVGDATGGQVAVAPGATAPIQLNGPTPHGTIASAVMEVSQLASPTAVPPPA